MERFRFFICLFQRPLTDCAIELNFTLVMNEIVENKGIWSVGSTFLVRESATVSFVGCRHITLAKMARSTRQLKRRTCIMCPAWVDEPCFDNL